MANYATENVTAIDSSKPSNLSDTPYEYLGNTTVPLGRANPPTKYPADAGVVLGTDVKLGHDDATGRPFGTSFNDRAPNDPSGYNAIGVPTYGDGPRNTTVTWGPDSSNLKTDQFTYLVAGLPVSKGFNTLT